ncbi:Alpha-tocopherol transfer protein-like [Araneus ventricosus]|uniref:Alpha-tocopherol transfer protein-like n=1 Tax=Araneus ventricosus TaxID=182803 RepID=A0A4Y2HTH0_ARAVE|nr:Alpha-tocopherol transfer protein-like [Araneus ventricosus]
MDVSRTQFLPFEITDINEPSIIANQLEINESPETRATCLEILRQNLKNLENIDPLLDDSFLLSFLRVSKFDSQKALQRVQKFYQQYDVLLDAYKRCTMPLHKAQKLDYLRVSPYRLKNNSFLLIGYNKKIDYKKYTFGERFYTDVLACHNLIENPVNQICGVTFLFDYEGFNIQAFLAYTPGWVRIFLSSFLDAFPCRLKALHLVNVPPLFSTVYKMAQPFLPKKTQERVFFHSTNGDWQNLHASIPREVLPEQYGGKIKNDDLINCLENIEDLEKKFLKSFAYGSLENQHRRKSMKVLC